MERKQKIGFSVNVLPRRDKKPQDIHITKLMPTDPVLFSTPEGDTKIPDPEIIYINHLSNSTNMWTMKKFMEIFEKCLSKSVNIQKL